MRRPLRKPLIDSRLRLDIIERSVALRAERQKLDFDLLRRLTSSRLDLSKDEIITEWQKGCALDRQFVVNDETEVLLREAESEFDVVLATLHERMRDYLRAAWESSRDPNVGRDGFLARDILSCVRMIAQYREQSVESPWLAFQLGLAVADASRADWDAKVRA